MNNKYDFNDDYEKNAQLQEDLRLLNEILPRIESRYLNALGVSIEQQIDNLDKKWKKKEIPKEIQEKSFSIVQRMIASLQNLLIVGGIPIDKNIEKSMMEMFISLIVPCVRRCFYIGIELASGNIPKEDGDKFMNLAINPINEFVILFMEVFQEKGTLSKLQSEELINMLNPIIIDIGNQHIILGIKDYYEKSKQSNSTSLWGY